jgi:hypothetical protein
LEYICFNERVFVYFAKLSPRILTKFAQIFIVNRQFYLTIKISLLVLTFSVLYIIIIEL